MIDFDGGELPAVEGEHVLVRKFFRIEASLPLFVGIAGSADVEFGGGRNGSLLERENIIARGRGA